MKRTFTYQLLVTSLLCTCISTFGRVDDGNVDYYYAFAKTILLDQDEEYIPENSEIYDRQSRFCRCTIIDSSLSVKDTLSGVATYWLLFDTTNIASGKELQRTQDFLYCMYRLNREKNEYRSQEIANAPHEILIADSLIRDTIKPKRIWMECYTPYYIPYHLFHVEFTIVPLKTE